MMHELALYFAILTGTFIEGEATLIAAGFAAHREILNPFLVCLTAFVGAQGTDWFHFLLGRHLGARIIDKKPWLKLKLEKMNQYINKHPNSILFFFRFMYGTRTVLPIAIGISDIPIRKFAIYSVM